MLNFVFPSRSAIPPVQPLQIQRNVSTLHSPTLVFLCLLVSGNWHSSSGLMAFRRSDVIEPVSNDGTPSSQLRPSLEHRRMSKIFQIDCEFLFACAQISCCTSCVLHYASGRVPPSHSNSYMRTRSSIARRSCRELLLWRFPGNFWVGTILISQHHISSVLETQEW